MGEVQGHADHSHHHADMIMDFRRRFWFSLSLSIPILIFSPTIQSIAGFSLQFSGINILSFILATLIFVYGGWPFLKGIYQELGKRQPGMMTLIALAISVAYIYSAAVVFGFSGTTFFWELATLIDVMLLGHWIEMRSVMGASRSLEHLAHLLPDTAHVKRDGTITDIHLEDVSEGDILVVKPGEKIPSDGTIVKGQAYMDESMLTGESQPVRRGGDDHVVGGSINGDNAIEITVTKTGKDSYISKVITLVKQAQAQKSKTQHLADKAAFWLTLIAISAGALTLGSWWALTGDIAFAIERMATVMVITCPHALGLAIPLVVAVSTTLSARNGLLIRNRTAFENARRINTVVFDKTGTLTEGRFGVTDVRTEDTTMSDDDVLRIAASLENQSDHPIAHGIVSHANKKGIRLGDAKDVNLLKGKGIRGKVDGESYHIVGPGYLNERGLSKKVDAHKRVTSVYLLHGDVIIGTITLSDTIRASSYEAVESLRNHGIRCYMLTGDNRDVAKEVSSKLGLDGHFAEVLPQEKQEKIIELQADGGFVAMVGDGINDAPALAQADIGIAIGSGTDIAAETADIVLVNSDPKDVVSLISFAKATYNKMIQNLFWATGYNAVAIPLAAGVLSAYGILISPAVGAALMSLSTIIVAINAKMLHL